MTPIGQLLRDIFNQDFSACRNATDFSTRFFAKPLAMADLKRVHDMMAQSRLELGGKAIPAALQIKGKKPGAPFAILSQLHGNEPAGLAGILLALALSEAGLLSHDVIGVIGNPTAAAQYFSAWEKAPRARQEKRDVYRAGISAEGELLPDGNRIPVDFAKRDDAHCKRAQELFALGQQISGIVDIHSARGDMVCITDHKRDFDLQHSPIRRVLTGLAEAISANASGEVTVQTLKTVLHPLPNIQCQVGIEAGKHESKDAPQITASFTLSLLYNLGITPVPALYDKEDGNFERYAVRPRLTYADLKPAKPLRKDDRVYMARPCQRNDDLPKNCASVAVRKSDGNFVLQTVLEYIVSPQGELSHALSQYEEMEAIERGQVVAVALPSGIELTSPSTFSGIFFSKSAALYPKDPAVGPWPVDAGKLASIKFCYPCDVSTMRLDFARGNRAAK